MKKLSAGLLIYRRGLSGTEVLLAHPGGPFWAKKDDGAWSIPKGEYEEAEEPLAAAKREFAEEIGQAAPAGNYIELATVKSSSGKQVIAFTLEADIDVGEVKSNTIMIEWPPRSGRQLTIPEVDRAEWFDLPTAKQKISKYQVEILAKLEQNLNHE